MRVISTDVAVIGAGLAGLYTALNVSGKYRVLVIDKGDGLQSSSVLAQGGIAACIDEDDTIEGHVNDTLVAGSYHNDPDAVEELVRGSSKQIARLIALGVEFDRDEEGKLKATLEGGHHFRRVLHSDGDATGRAIMKKIIEVAEKAENITRMDNTSALKLIINSQGRVCGICAVSGAELLIIRARIVLIATGGVGALYMNTTNPRTLTGDGLALAYKAGAVIRDACLVQFHPTALFMHNVEEHFLITEAMRGEGAILRNDSGTAFMEKYDERKELAPRDIVARAIDSEMKKSGSDHVWLDITARDREFLKGRFPNIYDRLASIGIHMEEDLIPVAPVAHYYVGGIRADLNGRTDVDCLYACGEVASTGVHGANRLASNSLLECVVFGEDCGIAISDRLDSMGDCNPAEGIPQTGIDEAELSDVSDDEYYEETILACRRYMSEDVSIVREQRKLEKVLEKLTEHERAIQGKTHSKRWYEAENTILVCRLIVGDALIRDSIGCHYKENGKR